MFDQDEDEKFKQMLGSIIGDGPAPYDVTTPLEQPDAPSQLSTPYMPQSAGGLGGYTPPPAAAPPQYLDHVQGHQFGGGDVAMLGGILAALLGGGKHRGEIAGSLAGQYGGAMMQANARADQRNQQVDQFNAQLAAKDDPLARWKADQQAQYQAGSLKARGDELALQKSREQRIADSQGAEDAKDPVEEAKRVAQARADVALDTRRQENDMEAGLKERLGEILGINKGKLGAPGAAPSGDTTGPAADPVKRLKQRQAEAALAGMDDGTVNPLTGKPVEPPKAATKSRTPFADTEFDDGGEELFNEKNSTAGNYQKNSDTDSELTKGIAAMKTMRDLLKNNGSQWGTDEKSAKLKGEFDTAKGVVQSSQAKLRALGVLQQREQDKVDAAIGADMGVGLSDLTSAVGLGDLRIGRLEGAIKSFEDMQGIGRHANGLRAKTVQEKPIGETDSGIKFSVDPDKEAKFNSGEGGGFGPGDQTGKPATSVQSTPGGQKLVQLISPSGKRGSRELSDSELQGLLAAGWKVAQ